MSQRKPGRRQFSAAIATALGVSLAGCNDSGDEEDGTENDTDTTDETGGNGTNETEETEDTDENATDEAEENTTDETGENATDENATDEAEENATDETGENTTDENTTDETEGNATDEAEGNETNETEENLTIEDEEEENPEVILSFVNENEEPVSVGMDIEITHNSESGVWSRSYVGNPEEAEEMSDGSVTSTVLNSGTQTVAVEPNEEGDFEAQETEFTFTEAEIENNVTKEIPFVLEGATPDSVRFQPATPEGEFWIEPSHAEGMAFQVADGSADPGANVVIGEWEEADYQTWNVGIANEEERYLSIAAAHSGHVLQVEGAGTEEGDNVNVGEDEGAENQLWTVTEQNDDQYSIQNVNSGIEIAIDGSGSEPGTNVLQQPFDGEDNQQHRFNEP